MDYGSLDFWNERYLEERKKGSDHYFDWYFTYADVKQMLTPYVKRRDRILVIGCGNSALSLSMHKDGFADITNLDISRIVVGMMRERHEGMEGLTYVCGDVRLMGDFPDDSFDVVIDKGLMDSQLAGIGAERDVAAMLEEVARVLRPGGYYLEMTYGEPGTRVPLLQRPEYSWTVDHSVLAFSVTHHLYIMKRDLAVKRQVRAATTTMNEKKRKAAAERAAALLAMATAGFEATRGRGRAGVAPAATAATAAAAAMTSEGEGDEDDSDEYEDDVLASGHWSDGDLDDEGIPDDSLPAVDLTARYARTGGPPESVLRATEVEVADTMRQVDAMVTKGQALRDRAEEGGD